MKSQRSSAPRRLGNAPKQHENLSFFIHFQQIPQPAGSAPVRALKGLMPTMKIPRHPRNGRRRSKLIYVALAAAALSSVGGCAANQAPALSAEPALAGGAFSSEGDLLAPSQPGARASSRGSSTSGSKRRVDWLDAGAVATAVRPHRPAFGSCQRLAAGASSEGLGAITVGWLVETNGDILRTKVQRSSFDGGPIEDCVLSVARKVEFPASRATTEIAWTVRFRSDPRLAER